MQTQTTENNTNAKVMEGLLLAGFAALGYFFFKGDKETKKSNLGALPLLDDKDKKEDYPRLWIEVKKFQALISQKLQSDYKEDEAALIDYLKNDRPALVERVGWVYSGNYGSEAMDRLRNQYKDIVKYKKGKLIGKALRALAIETFYWYCYGEYKALNAAKVRSIVTKTLSKEEMEKFNTDIVEKEILFYENNGDDSLKITDFEKDGVKVKSKKSLNGKKRKAK